MTDYASPRMLSAVTVVPCFNEEKRLHADALLRLSNSPQRSILFVNDGSRDATAAILDELHARRPDVVDVLHLERNSGKAEAVRAGLQRAIAKGADLVGYFDADLATPPEEMLRLLQLLDDTGLQFAMASRVALLGRRVERTPLRHYLGRTFATAASLALEMPVYDTQCGAKALRVTPTLTHALSRPFTSRWVFDVELMIRLLEAGLKPSDFIEMPLRAWEDVKGSKLSPSGMAGAAKDLARLAWKHRRR